MTRAQKTRFRAAIFQAAIEGLLRSAPPGGFLPEAAPELMRRATEIVNATMVEVNKP